MTRVNQTDSLDAAHLPSMFVRWMDELLGVERTHRLINAAPGTLENIRRGRLKRVDFILFGAIKRAAINAMQAHIRKLEVQIKVAEQYCDGLAQSELDAVATEIEKLQTLIKRAPR